MIYRFLRQWQEVNPHGDLYRHRYFQGYPCLSVGARMSFLSSGARRSQPDVEGLPATSRHASGGGICQLMRPWPRLVVFSPRSTDAGVR